MSASTANQPEVTKRRRISIRSVAQRYWWPLIGTTVLGLATSVYMVPRWLAERDARALTIEARKAMEAALAGDPNLQVRIAAVEALGNIGDAESLQVLSDAFTRQPLLADSIAPFIQKSSPELVSGQRMAMLSELRRVYQNEQLIELDDEVRLVGAIGDLITKLREFRSALNSDARTPREKEIAESLRLSDKLDLKIDGLGNLLNQRLSRLNRNFSRVMTDLDDELAALRLEDADYSTAESKLLVSNILQRLHRFNELHARMVFSKDSEESKEIHKFVKIVQTLSGSDSPDVLAELESVARGEAVPYTVKFQGIDTLGDIGQVNQIGGLLALAAHRDPEVRERGIRALGQILRADEGLSRQQVP